MNSSNPYEPPAPVSSTDFEEIPRSSAIDLYKQVTPLRREDVCSKMLIAHVLAIVLLPFIPFLFPLAILTILGAITVCVMALTGPIYVRRLDYKHGGLDKWGVANKIAAVILVVFFVVILVALSLAASWMAQQ